MMRQMSIKFSISQETLFTYATLITLINCKLIVLSNTLLPTVTQLIKTTVGRQKDKKTTTSNCANIFRTKFSNIFSASYCKVQCLDTIYSLIHNEN